MIKNFLCTIEMDNVTTLLLSIIFNNYTLLLEPVQFWRGSIFIPIKGFQPQIVLILFLFSMKHSYLCKAKITPYVLIFLQNEINNILMIFLRSIKWSSGYDDAFPILRSWFQNHCNASRSTLPSILPKTVKWLSGELLGTLW